MSGSEMTGWDRLRHGGLLLDPPRLRQVAASVPAALPWFHERELRRFAGQILEQQGSTSDFVSFVLESVCGFTPGLGSWARGSQVGSEWGRRIATGETVKPRHLWRGDHGALLPVFIDTEGRLGIGRSRRTASQVVQWLRAGQQRLAVLTNGRQWRLIFAGLDFDAWCEWDVELWFEEGGLSAQVQALRTLVSPAQWTPAAAGSAAPLVQAVLDSRKGQAELSAVLGERVREAVELLVQGHGDVLKEACSDCSPADIYRVAVRVVMRMVVVLFAESRELLPRDNALYHGSYGLTGLLEELEKAAARGGHRLAHSYAAWPRVLSLFHLVSSGSHHPALPVPAYGGDLFAGGDASAADALMRTLAVFETACFERQMLPDRDVHRILERLTRTKVRVRQGRSSTWVPAPVDFSDLSSEYIGILYEGLLDFELRTAPAGDPVVFLAVGNQPALPLSRLEGMDDRALGSLLEKMKDTSAESATEEALSSDGGGDDDVADGEAAGDTAADDGGDEEDEADSSNGADEEELVATDERHATRTKAERWARRAVEVGKLVRRPTGTLSPERRAAYETAVDRKATQLVQRVVLPGEWYLVRWGGTRKGSGTFYTRPGLAVPTVHRSLRPLAFSPPVDENGRERRDAEPAAWTPKAPEEILALKVCDPACGSGTFPVAALRFLTDALYQSLHVHGRLAPEGDRVVVRLLEAPGRGPAGAEPLAQELLPCRPDDPMFEPRLRAILRRHVVERCIYGVDLDPLAVELCRLALWIETMDRNLPFSFLDHKVKCGNSLAGAWFDQFQHYPAMAWKNREGGDKNHGNGVHFEKEARLKAIKLFVSDTLAPDLRRFLSGRTLFSEDLQQQASGVHDEALATLARLHDLPVQDSEERARIYRTELLQSESFRGLKAAMDCWCACWFWPTDALDHAPLPTTLAAPSPETRSVVVRLASRLRFFHWELEFPDVFRAPGAGFDAILGNPPWDIAKPNSKEFFSNIDPLYRSYGKQEALRHQTANFANAEVERAWLDYNAEFRAQSNFMAYAENAYGDPARNEDAKDRFSLGRGNAAAHERWRAARARSRGYADPAHPFQHQGSADLNLYKAFLELSHALLRSGGRLGFVVPSGLYSDQGTSGLRRLFLDHCSWEWIFGFENREKVFDIDSRFKFNPVIVRKGGSTEAIQTAFMRRKLEDWEQAERSATPYARTQVDRFSPRSRSILEIQSKRDLEVLEKIYANSVLLGDQGLDGWGITYAREFDMTNDSKLFPPRPKWEEQGYRPDEYSRWLKGNWRPIGELWSLLGVDPAHVTPIDPACEAEIASRGADVQKTPWKLRCAQPPYDGLPVPRADVPAGIILSREADEWIREDEVEDVALPLYEGRMIGQFDFSEKGWVSGKGRSAVWREVPWASKTLEPQYLMSHETAHREGCSGEKLPLMNISSATNTRTLVCAFSKDLPCNHSLNPIRTRDAEFAIALAALFNSFVMDAQCRVRLGGLNVSFFVLDELAVARPAAAAVDAIIRVALPLSLSSTWFADRWMMLREKKQGQSGSWRRLWALTVRERLRWRAAFDAVAAAVAGLDEKDLMWILDDCDWPSHRIGSLYDSLSTKGFWRVDQDRDPQLRQTVLALVAFANLAEKIQECGGDRCRGLAAFLSQNLGEGWDLPDMLTLDDHGLGHDEGAKRAQPVATRLGARFLDWQLAQTAEESWRECDLHARNLLGAAAHGLLKDSSGGAVEVQADSRGSQPKIESGSQRVLF